MGPSNVFRQSSLDDIDNIALFKKVFFTKIIMKTLFVKISKISFWIIVMLLEYKAQKLS